MIKWTSKAIVIPFDHIIDNGQRYHQSYRWSIQGRRWSCSLTHKPRHQWCLIFLPPDEGDSEPLRTKDVYMLTYLDSNDLSPLSIFRMRAANWHHLTEILLGIVDHMKGAT